MEIAAVERLAPDQRAAATARPGPVLCVAPAGSGKTATLVARIAWLIAGPHRVAPGAICAVTFNRRAAEELRERLSGVLAPLGVDSEEIRVRTFHALGREILADAGVDVRRLMDRAELLRTLFPDVDRVAHGALDTAFSRLKLDLRLAPDDAVTLAAATVTERRPPATGGRGPAWLDGRTAAAYSAYEEALRDRGALDFDDLVIRALAFLERDAGALATWRDRCGHLLVDEVQDLDRSQLDLAVLLAGDARRIFLVGDDDQTIYAWRLADVRRVIGLAERLPGLRRFDLTVNYRCPAPVVSRAVRLVAHNRERFRKTVRPRQDAAGELRLAPIASDDVTRARRLLRRWIDQGLPIDGSPTGSATRWAVLARTNAELAPFAGVAVEIGIPFASEDDRLLLDDRRVEEALIAIERAGDPGAVPLPAIASACPDHPLLGDLLSWAAPFPSVAALRTGLTGARERLASLRRADAALVLATVHGTKGLEFDHVAVVGLDDGRFPSRRSLEESEDPARALEEERRLGYVAWTRARRSLTLVYDPGAPSRFLLEAFTESELRAA